MERPARVRLVFEDRRLLSKSQRKEGLERCWVLLEPELATISDLVAHLSRCFDLHRSCPDGLILSIDGFILPSFESTCIIRDKNIISVRKKGVAMRELMNACDDAHDLEDYDIVEKQPRFTSDKLLAIKEFQEESGGYKSEDEDDACDLPENAISIETSLSKNANSKRKRERSDKLMGSKKKKLKLTSLEKATNSDVGVDLDFEKSKFDSEKHGHSKKNIHRKVKPINQDVKLHMKTASQITDNDENTCCSPDKEERQSDPQASESFSIAKHNPVEESSQRVACESLPSSSMKKFPSRSARRKKARRRWRRELANSQKHELFQSQMPASDMHQKPQECEKVGQNRKHEGMNKNSGLKEMDQNSKNNRHQKMDQNGECKNTDQNNRHQELDQHCNLYEEIVPIVVRPGYIRFEPVEELDKQNIEGPMETLQWNGPTNKKKGQKWGREKVSFRRNNDNVCNGESNGKRVVEDMEMIDGHINFEKLVPLTCQPKEGDVIAYRLVELSSSWCPELSPFRVGKVTSYDSTSMKVSIGPVPGYPIFCGEKREEEESMSESNISFYKEDGSLEIDFPSLVDVRLFPLSESEPVVSHSNQFPLTESEPVISNKNQFPLSESEPVISNKDQNDKTLEAAAIISSDLALSHCTGKETATPSTEKEPDMNWEQIKQALEEKKAQLLKNDGHSGWSPKPSSGTWSYRALRGSALGPTISFLRAKNDL